MITPIMPEGSPEMFLAHKVEIIYRPGRFPIDGCWCDMQNGCWYESMTDSVWRQMADDGWMKVS